MNSKKELLSEIAALAPILANKPEASITLLDLIDAFDRVLARRKMDPESLEAAGLYKAMLRLGRLSTWQLQPKAHHGSALDILQSDTISPQLQKSYKEGRIDVDVRAPLGNLTNKFGPVHESATLRSPKIQLPKLKLTNLLDAQAEESGVFRQRESALALKLQKLQQEPAERDQRSCRSLNEVIAANYHVAVPAT